MRTEKSLGFSVVDFNIRADLNVSVIEFVFMHMVFNLNDPERGGCYMSKESFALRLGVSSRAIFSIIQRLSDKGYVKNKNGILTLTVKCKNRFGELRLDKDDEKKLHGNTEDTSERTMKKVHRSYENTSQGTVKKDHKSYEDTSRNSKLIKKNEIEKKLSEEERNLLSGLINEVTSFFVEARFDDVKAFLLSLYEQDEEEYTDFILAFEYNSEQAQSSERHIKVWNFFKKEWKQYSYEIKKLKEEGPLPEGEWREYYSGLRERGKERKLEEYTVRILTKYLRNRSK